jgi:hypothetical protein
MVMDTTKSSNNYRFVVNPTEAAATIDRWPLKVNSRNLFYIRSSNPAEPGLLVALSLNFEGFSAGTLWALIFNKQSTQYDPLPYLC